MNKRHLHKTIKTWKKRSQRENYYVNANWLEQHVVPMTQISQHATPWIFSRLPCSKGDALENYMTQLFPLQDMQQLDEQALLDVPELINYRGSVPNFISGHHSLTSVLYQLLPAQKMVHITLLKEPISRVVGCYNQQATELYKKKEIAVSDLTFENIFSKRQRKNINNAQAKALAGLRVDSEKVSDNELYFYAKHSLDNCFSLVGVASLLPEFIAILRRQTGIKLVDTPSSSNDKTKVMLEITNQHLEQIKQDNKVDQQLYEYALSKFLEVSGAESKQSNVVSLRRKNI